MCNLILYLDSFGSYFLLIFLLSHYVTYGLHEATGSAPSTPQRINLNSGPKTVPGSSTTVLNTTAQKKSSLKSHSTSSVPLINKSDIVPVIVPRTSMRSEPVADSRKEVGVAGRTMPFPLQTKAADMRKFLNNRDDVDKPLVAPITESGTSKGSELSGFADKSHFPASVSSTQGIPKSLKGLNYARCLGNWQMVNKWIELSAINQQAVLQGLSLYCTILLLHWSMLWLLHTLVKILMSLFYWMVY